MIDTHCHLTFPHYAGRVQQIVAEAAAVGVRGMITVSTTSADCQHALELATTHNRIWCTAGIHPLHSDEPRDWDSVKAVGGHPRCVAWGELGLDYHYTEPPRPLQHQVLAEQLEHIARWEQEPAASGTWPKAIVVHCRDAFDDLVAIFRNAPFDPSRYVFHCFTSTPDDARKVLDFGAAISFTGVVTFKNAKEVAEAAKLVPLDRMMVETDAPFLSPEPVRNERPNHPKNVIHVARFIASLRSLDLADFEQQLDTNAERIFGMALPPADA